MSPGILLRIKISFMETDTVPDAPVTYKLSVRIALGASEMEIAMRHSERRRRGGMQEQTRQSHGIRPSAYSKKDRPRIREQSSYLIVKLSLHLVITMWRTFQPALYFLEAKV